MMSWLLAATGAALTAGALAGGLWVAVRRRHAWERGARGVGLVVIREGVARGVYGGYRIDAEWDGPALAVALHGPGLVDRQRADRAQTRLAAVLTGKPVGEPDRRLRWAVRSDTLASAALLAVRELQRTGDAVLVVRVRAEPGAEGDQLRGAVETATWIAEQLGWAPEDPTSTAVRTSLEDPDPRVRLRAWEGLLGGWVSTGYTAAGDLGRARIAAASDDPWIAALGALHLGPDGLDALRATVTNPASPDVLVGRALRGVWDALPPEVLASLLAREGDEVVVRACLGLGRVGTGAELPALRGWAADEGARGTAARRAIAAIVARIGAASGQVALADRASGEVSIADRVSGSRTSR